MFKSIAWQEFVIAAAAAAACYYTLILAVFYSREIAAKLKGTGGASEPLKARQTHRSPHNLMGPIAAFTPLQPGQARQSSASADEVEVADTVKTMESQDIGHTPGQELLHELTNLFEIMKEGQPSEEAYVKNIRTLISQYVHHINAEEYAGITQAIATELSASYGVKLSEDSVRDFWPEANNNKLTQ